LRKDAERMLNVIAFVLWMMLGLALWSAMAAALLH
jgi:hypothetical protein